MSMTPVETWAVDLAEVGPIYPMVGTEGILFILGLVFWIGWHVWQIRHENKTYAEEVQNLNTPEKLERAMREQRLD